ncbi:MAG: T9SS type A sorting domain-containing protein [Bacteroidales bacterium]|nr:T9SS type A sorting domain-containing protein [Bacteroidales bacterium]
MKNQFHILRRLSIALFIFLPILLSSQNQNPVAINDTVKYQSLSHITIDVLANDLNPTVEPIEIWEIGQGSFGTITPDQRIHYYDSVRNVDHLPLSFSYRIRMENDPECYSNWAKVILNYTPDLSAFFARPDSFRAYMHKPVRVNLLKNDHLVNPLDTVVITYATVFGTHSGKIIEKDDSTITYQADPYGSNEEILIGYHIRKKGTTWPSPFSFQDVTAKCLEQPFAYLDQNNIKARINPFGNHFNTFGDPCLGFFVPKESTQSTVFLSALWFGGVDEQDALHFGGEQYRTSPYSGNVHDDHDFWPGPLSDTALYDPVYDSLWNRVWKFEGWEVEHHKYHWDDPGYFPPMNILTWPAHGNPALGEAENLAPFFDNNGDGRYNPFEGDYPDLCGHQCLFFIYNDFMKPHTESEGERVGVEVHGWAYAFNLPNDSAFWNTIFFHYDIYNRSGNTYYNMYIGNFTDLDIGYAQDDFMECDVERSMFISYNGDSIDGFGHSEAYGEHPPAQGVILLGGATMDPDGIDNPRYDNFGRQLCNESVNGTNFGDGVADNERYGMHFFLHEDPPPWFYGKYNAENMYDFLTGKWPGGEPLIYGGNGRLEFGGYGPECSFMFPGLSDSLNWGVGCQLPNGPVNWTQEIAGNLPHDTRGIMSTGPFTFHPGNKQQIDLAYTFARDYNGDPYSSVDLLRQYADVIRGSYESNTLPNGDPFFGIEESFFTQNLIINLYPNPAGTHFYLKFVEGSPKPATIELFTIEGRAVSTIRSYGLGTASVNIAPLASGIYFVKITLKNQTVVKKLVKK